MIIDDLDPRPAVLKAGALVAIIAANTPIAVYLLSTGRTCTLKKLRIANRNPANAEVDIGTGLAGAYAQVLPTIFVPGNTDRVITEDELEDVEFTADITARDLLVGAAAPNDIQLLATVEEYQGLTG